MQIRLATLKECCRCKVEGLTRGQRHLVVSKLRSVDTKPEMIVRRSLHGMGYRHRLHSSDLPGKPDLVFQGRRKVNFVNGCFGIYIAVSRDRADRKRTRTFRTTNVDMPSPAMREIIQRFTLAVRMS
ncbi:hypothetical protein [Arthrobacter alpinus]|uniref:hypothetical protein n=1 Tax=Arthrobacter alpinus TaxID=656366 RepID=UPI0028F73C6B|nr:hypothetical protein [Arthrobacter alpinus]